MISIFRRDIKLTYFRQTFQFFKLLEGYRHELS